MTKCYQCGGTEIVKGKIRRSGDDCFSDTLFAPEGLRFLAVTLWHGTELHSESFACLSCGAVWSHTNANDLREFVRKHCKGPNFEKSKG
jgi:hypothetical protein